MNDYIKEFCGIPHSVNVYDEQIEANKHMALARLEVANVTTDETNELVKDYIATFCRIRMVTEPSATFINSETARMKDIIVLLTYGRAKQ